MLNAGGVLVSVDKGFTHLKISASLTAVNSYHTPHTVTTTPATVGPVVHKRRSHMRSLKWVDRRAVGMEDTEDTGDREGREATGGTEDTEVMVEVVRARGHEHVTAEHASTWELTSDDWLTPAGDCILGVEADRVPADFDREFVSACRDVDATIEATLRADGREQVVTGRGDPDLTFADDRSLVARTSDYVDDRTVMVGADTAAAGFDRDLVAALSDGADLECVFRVA